MKQVVPLISSEPHAEAVASLYTGDPKFRMAGTLTPTEGSGKGKGVGASTETIIGTRCQNAQQVPSA